MKSAGQKRLQNERRKGGIVVHSRGTRTYRPSLHTTADVMVIIMVDM